MKQDIQIFHVFLFQIAMKQDSHSLTSEMLCKVISTKQIFLFQVFLPTVFFFYFDKINTGGQIFIINYAL